MLDPAELATVADRFGVSDDQVIRDHFISHILEGLTSLDRNDLAFFGGTALARTYLPDGRLSEDIDLWAQDRTTMAAILEQRLPQVLSREFPGSWWLVPLTRVRDVEPALLRTGDGTTVRIQLLSAQGMFDWPTEIKSVDVRYSDAGRATLHVPTLAAFTAMKTTAWADRHAERDLYDLSALAELGAIDSAAASLAADATGVRVAQHMFDRLPTGFRWQEQLAHQLKELPDPRQCLRRVRTAFGTVLGWDPA